MGSAQRSRRAVRRQPGGTLAAALLLLGLGALPAWTQNLLLNPDFDQGLSEWVAGVTGLGGVTFDGTLGSPAPGAARLWVVYLDPYSDTALGQCVSVSAPGTIDLAARFKELSGLAPDRRVGARFHGGPNCSGTALQVVYQNAATLLPDGWYEVTRLGHSLPAGTQSAWVTIETSVDFPGDSGDLRFDHVRFGPAGTTPVALQELSIE